MSISQTNLTGLDILCKLWASNESLGKKSHIYHCTSGHVHICAMFSHSQMQQQKDMCDKQSLSTKIRDSSPLKIKSATSQTSKVTLGSNYKISRNVILDMYSLAGCLLSNFILPLNKTACSFTLCMCFFSSLNKTKMAR